MPFYMPHAISYYTYISTMSLSSTISDILSLLSEHLNRSHDPEHIHFGGNLSTSTRYWKCL